MTRGRFVRNEKSLYLPWIHRLHLLPQYQRPCFFTVRRRQDSFIRYRGHSTAPTRTTIDDFVPRSRFNRSIFTTPLLLFLRLFYQATSFDKYVAPTQTSGPATPIRGTLAKVFSMFIVKHSAGRLQSYSDLKNDDAHDIASRMSIDAFRSFLQDQNCPVKLDSTLRSMTWVKSLSAPLSHEYLQFVVECKDSGKLYRLIAERDTDGDWAYFIASSGDCEASNEIKQLRPYDYQHDLPLPLLSVSWYQLPVHQRPTIDHLATVLVETSQLCLEYKVMREHCWWYAEAVFECMFASAQYQPEPRPFEHAMCELKHWPLGEYRYSYIVLGKRLLRRRLLVEQAKLFREEMDTGGQLRW